MSSTQTASSDRLDGRTAYFETTWPEASTAVVVAHGELDAANVDDFIDYALRRRTETDRLIVDLSGLAFFATAGFSALHTLNVQCVGAEIRWALVPSPAVHRLLRICDPDGALPTCTDINEALAAVQTDQPRLLQLVPKPS